MTWLETTQGIITLIASGVALLGTILTLCVKLYNALKEIVKHKEWKKIAKFADAAMTAAEESGKSGADKKQMVIESVEAGCKELGIVVDLCKLSEYIDECIEFVNKMNKK